jgi:hypothetical protein
MAACFDLRSRDLPTTFTFIKTGNYAPIYKSDKFKELVKNK